MQCAEGAAWGASQAGLGRAHRPGAGPPGALELGVRWSEDPELGTASKRGRGVWRAGREVYLGDLQDEVIRKRLLIDGDGAGDDRRINLLVKSFIKWCNSGSQEEGYSQYQRMLSTLSQCEFSMGKTLLVYDMNLREMENYEKIYKEIEYDALAKVIQHHPDRHETLKELEALGKELEHLSHIKESVEDKLELRRKQFHVLLSTIHELQQTLENDDKLSEVDDAQESAMEADPKP
ncbi:THO complex subunit 7 homolog isoform X2 [Peromyscus californicus insignis]|uniref:THO complex subunit 7 homolog isoform X2 n=2 Tax=Peromyscus TaxID=10040 RepID=UPI0022A7C2F9|nr:THO complex subunit 7 homolog isoform X2 [Peromyscus californicus insignis]